MCLVDDEKAYTFDEIATTGIIVSNTFKMNVIKLFH